MRFCGSFREYYTNSFDKPGNESKLHLTGGGCCRDRGDNECDNDDGNNNNKDNSNIEDIDSDNNTDCNHYHYY